MLKIQHLAGSEKNGTPKLKHKNQNGTVTKALSRVFVKRP